MAYVAEEREAEVGSLGTIGTRQGDSDKRLRQLQSTGKTLHLVSEAGPWGYWLSRDLTKTRLTGGVVAPGSLPKKAGDRGKTEGREAGQLARRLRAGALRPVYGPAGEEAARRDVGRAREESLKAGKAAKARRKALLLRPDLRSEGQAHWGAAQRRWRAAVVCPTPAQQSVCHEYGRAVSEPQERRQGLAAELQPLGKTWRWAPVVEALQALRGGQCTGALTRSAELGDLPRFATPRQLRRSLGRTPREHSSGERRRPGALTKTGTAPARRALSEGAGA